MERERDYFPLTLALPPIGGKAIRKELHTL